MHSERQDIGERDQRGEPAAQREGDEQRGFGQQLGDAEVHARDRVVRGLLVRGQSDAIGEGGGHGGAMRPDVADVAKGEPEAQRERECQRRDEQSGECECGHDGRAGVQMSRRFPMCARMR